MYIYIYIYIYIYTSAQRASAPRLVPRRGSSCFQGFTIRILQKTLKS